MKNFARRLKLPDNVNTDCAVSPRYGSAGRDPVELSRHIFADIEPDFSAKIVKGDVLVAGLNFGCGSSREQVPHILREAGFQAVIAKSFARMFYRSAFNCGLPLIECNTDFIDDGDEIVLDIKNAKFGNTSKGLIFDIQPLSPVLKALIRDGGVIEHFRKQGGFTVE